MQIRAENDPRYSRKFLIMGIIAIGFSLYCLLDGFVRYPARREAGFEEFKTDYKTFFTGGRQNAITRAEFEATADPRQRQEWEVYSESRGIPTGAKIAAQFVMAAGTALAGLALIATPLRSRGRWIEISDAGVTSSWGEGFNFDQVETVNKRKWRSKGIAKIVYRDNNNRKRVFVIDDYKFDRYPTDEILYELEQRIDIERITNGPPEPPPGESGTATGAPV
jgi:hypothetical protein